MSKYASLKTGLNSCLTLKSNLKGNLWIFLITVVSLFFNSCKEEIYNNKDVMIYSGKDKVLLSAISSLNGSSFLVHREQTDGHNVYDWDKALYKSNFGDKTTIQVIVPRFEVNNSIDSYLIVDLDKRLAAENIEIISAVNKLSKTYTDHFASAGYKISRNSVIEEKNEQLHDKVSKKEMLISNHVKRGDYLKARKVDRKTSTSARGQNTCYYSLSGSYMWEANIGACQGMGWTTTDQIQNIFLPTLANFLPDGATVYYNNIFIFIEADNLSEGVVYSAVSSALQLMQQTNSNCITSIHLININISGSCNSSGGGSGGGGSSGFENVEATMPFWAYLGSKPLYEYSDKCAGLNNIWNDFPDNEVFGYVTQDYKLIVTDVVTISGGAVSGLYNHDGVLYYPFSDVNGPPTENYAGMVHAAGKYFIPVRASVHTHTPSRSDGTDGVTNFMVSSDDNALALAYPTIKHFVIGNGAIGSYLPQYGPVYSSAYNVEATGNLLATCYVIY